MTPWCCVWRSQPRVLSRSVTGEVEEQVPQADNPSMLISWLVSGDCRPWTRWSTPFPFLADLTCPCSLIPTHSCLHCPPWYLGVKGSNPLPQLQPHRPLWVRGVRRRGAWVRRAFTLLLLSCKDAGHTLTSPEHTPSPAFTLRRGAGQGGGLNSKPQCVLFWMPVHKRCTAVGLHCCPFPLLSPIWSPS